MPDADANPYDVTSVNNLDIAGLIRRIDRIIYEFHHCSSASSSGVRKKDRERFDSWIELLTSYKDDAQGREEMDTPKSHTREYPLEYVSNESRTGLKNQAIVDIIYMLENMITDLAHSDSAGDPNRLSEHDEQRFNEAIEGIEGFLANHVDEHTPSDMPEQAGTKSGATATASKR